MSVAERAISLNRSGESTLGAAPNYPNYENLFEEVVATKQDVDARILDLAKWCVATYQDEDPLFVCVLRGGAPFSSKLMFAIAEESPEFHPEMDYITIRTYDEDEVAKEPELAMDLSPRTRAAGRRVVLLDDMLDKGITADCAKRHLEENHGATGVDLLVLAEKEQEREKKFFQHATRACFGFPPVWGAGMGLNVKSVSKEAFRWTPCLGIVKSETV